MIGILVLDLLREPPVQMILVERKTNLVPPAAAMVVEDPAALVKDSYVITLILSSVQMVWEGTFAWRILGKRMWLLPLKKSSSW